jgi:hypothetical protein
MPVMRTRFPVGGTSPKLPVWAASTNHRAARSIGKIGGQVP